jgi:hypothetical protein
MTIYAYDMNAPEGYSYEMHAREVHAHETHVYEIHALEMYARKVWGKFFRSPTLQTVVQWSICQDLSCKVRVLR